MFRDARAAPPHRPVSPRCSLFALRLRSVPLDASLDPAIATAVAQRDARRFCEAILPAVSRTFALGIRVLPGHLGQAVLDAYLLCRIADTVEDAPGIAPEAKSVLFREMLAGFDDPTAVARFMAGVDGLPGEPAHLALVEHADLVYGHFSELPARTRAVVREWVTEMVVGMEKFVHRYPDGIRIQTLDEYKEYCYYVAGTVGYMLTDLWFEHAPSIGKARYAILRERCRAFAEALQTVNILKDVAVDAEKENSIYVPEELLRAHGSTQGRILAPDLVSINREALGRLIDLAWHDLEEARTYLLDIPRRAISIRLFCLLPLLFAYATMRDLVQSTAMLRPGGTVKISRREVKSLLMAGPMLVMSNAGVRKLVERVRRRAFELAFA
jgi:farnesyl-diphosphate farnesyltransferase